MSILRLRSSGIPRFAAAIFGIGLLLAGCGSSERPPEATTNSPATAPPAGAQATVQPTAPDKNPNGQTVRNVKQRGIQ